MNTLAIYRFVTTFLILLKSSGLCRFTGLFGRASGLRSLPYPWTLSVGLMTRIASRSWLYVSIDKFGLKGPWRFNLKWLQVKIANPQNSFIYFRGLCQTTPCFASVSASEWVATGKFGISNALDSFGGGQCYAWHVQRLFGHLSLSDTQFAEYLLNFIPFEINLKCNTSIYLTRQMVVDWSLLGMHAAP